MDCIYQSDECSNINRYTRGMCTTHYARWQKYKDPHYTKRNAGPWQTRWMKRVLVTRSGCWDWTGALDRNGYGRYNDGQGNYNAHRAVWEILVAKIPAGVELDHLCRNRSCCNPDHLEQVSRLENVRRGRSGWNNKSKQFCAKGHEFTTENTLLPKRGGRACKICSRAAALAANRKARGGIIGPDNKDKTHCKHGHEFTVENTKLTKTGRSCRICGRESHKRMRERKKAAKAS